MKDLQLSPSIVKDHFVTEVLFCIPFCTRDIPLIDPKFVIKNTSASSLSLLKGCGYIMSSRSFRNL